MTYAVEMTSDCVTSNIKGIASQTFEALVLVLLKAGIYEVRRLDWLRCHDIYTKFHDDRSGIRVTLRVLPE
jgi:hypothetical protein